MLYTGVIPSLAEIVHASTRLRESSLARRVATGAAWSVLASIASRAMAFVMSVVIVRTLGDESFGRFGIVSATLTTFSVIGTLGIGVAATKLVAQHRTGDAERAGRSLASAVTAALAVGGCLALALGFSAPWLARQVLGDAGLTPAMRLCGASLFFMAWSSAQAGGLAGIEAFSTSAKVSMLGGAVISLFAVLGVWRWGFLGAVAAVPLGNAVQCMLQEVALRRACRQAKLPYANARPSSEMRAVLAVAIPATLGTAVYIPATWLGSVILVRSAGYQEMAVFAVADQWFNLVLMFPVVLGGVLLPVMTNVFSASDGEASRTLLRRTFLGNLGISALPLLAIAPFGFLILRIYGPSYASSWLVFSTMVSAACLFAALSPIGHALTAAGRMWLGSAMNLGWSAVHLGLTYLLVVRSGQGAFGLALARLLAYGVHAIWSLGYLRSILRRRPDALQVRV